VQQRLPDADGFIGTELLSRFEEVRIDYRGVSNDPVDPGPRFIARCCALDDIACNADTSCVTSVRCRAHDEAQTPECRGDVPSTAVPDGGIAGDGGIVGTP
jgi:hypothetical protein